MKKPTMQDIADALDISRVTVWKVLNNQPGVSKILSQRILEKASELGYKRQNLLEQREIKKITKSRMLSSVTVSVVVSRPESSVFWVNMIHQIAKELTKSDINLMYTYLPSRMPPSYHLPPVLSDDTVQGIIVLNVYDSYLINALNQLNIPKVFLDIVPSFPTDKLSGDLILLEGNSCIYKITTSVLEKGRKRIGFIGDINYARTNMERYLGYCRAMQDSNTAILPEYCMVNQIGLETYAEEITAFLKNMKVMPEAFVCVSDFVAHFVIRFLHENGYKVPEDIAVSGFDGSKEYLNVAGSLTTVPVDTPTLGKRLVKQLLYRMEHPGYPLEIIFLNFSVRYGESTEF